MLQRPRQVGALGTRALQQQVDIGGSQKARREPPQHAGHRRIASTTTGHGLEHRAQQRTDAQSRARLEAVDRSLVMPAAEFEAQRAEQAVGVLTTATADPGKSGLAVAEVLALAELPEQLPGDASAPMLQVVGKRRTFAIEPAGHAVDVDLGR
jgi:hypothetical protein